MWYRLFFHVDIVMNNVDIVRYSAQRSEIKKISSLTCSNIQGNIY